MHLLAMQQNGYCGYPQIFWTSSSALPSSSGAPPVGLCHPRGIGTDQDVCFPLPASERKRPQGNRGDGIRLCFLVVFLLILLAIVGVGLAMFQIFHLQKELQEFSSSGCVPPSPERLKGAVNRTVEKKARRSAHTTGKAIQQAHPLEWETTHGHAFLSGVRYKDRGLVIEEGGLYFIYSKVFFRGQSCTSQPLDHTVFKRNPSYPDDQVLMEGRKMNFCLAKRMWGKSSYLGAVFNLSRQDSVYVRVSEPTLVNSEESKTFFGLYML